MEEQATVMESVKTCTIQFVTLDLFAATKTTLAKTIPASYTDTDTKLTGCSTLNSLSLSISLSFLADQTLSKGYFLLEWLNVVANS